MVNSNDKSGVAGGGEASCGKSANYYKLPDKCTELQDLISYKDMNSQIGEIFRACYRYGEASHSNKLRDANKIFFYAQAEIARLEHIANNGITGGIAGGDIVENGPYGSMREPKVHPWRKTIELCLIRIADISATPDDARINLHITYIKYLNRMLKLAINDPEILITDYDANKINNIYTALYLDRDNIRVEGE